MTRTMLLAAAAALPTAMLLSCSSPTPAPAPGNSGTTPANNTVTVKDFKFTPATLTIPKGSTVTWKFEDTTAHTATSVQGSATTWDSGLKKSGESFSFKFDNAGTFDYLCTPHPDSMK